MKFAVATLLGMWLAFGSGERPIREGYATTYSYHDRAVPGVVFIATTRQGLTLSDANDPVALKRWESQLSQPSKPFHISVFADHIVAIDPRNQKASIVALRDVVEIDWQK